ncbi:MAG: 6-phosphofructokinase, partial [Deltaproteobacteria bacterium]|nr:6-phosphofructokinase [Deltaproteobacteria bacterium]
ALSGMAGGADLILVPEKPFNIDEVCAILKKRHERRGKTFSIVVVAEGAVSHDNSIKGTSDKMDVAFDHPILGGISVALSKEIEKRTGYETRYVILGHIQRGGAPTPTDRILATRLGLKAVDLVANNEFGKMVATVGGNIVAVDVRDIAELDKHGNYIGKTKTLDMNFYKESEVFFG